MSETVIVSFRIEDGIITKVQQYTPDMMYAPILTDRSDIERAVDRVANTPVGGKEER